MANTTLFLIQAAYSNTEKVWIDLAEMAQTDDSIIVLGDAVLQITLNIVKDYSNLYCLSNEQTLLNDDVKEHISVIEYTELADLVLQFRRCVTLK